MSKRKQLCENHPLETVSRTAYWKAVRDEFARMCGKRYSHTYVRECANGIKSVSENTLSVIKAAMSKVPCIPKNRRVHEGA